MNIPDDIDLYMKVGDLWFRRCPPPDLPPTPLFDVEQPDTTAQTQPKQNIPNIGTAPNHVSRILATKQRFQTNESKRQVVREFEQSNLPKEEFAAKYGFTTRTLDNWRSLFRTPSSSPSVYTRVDVVTRTESHGQYVSDEEQAQAAWECIQGKVTITEQARRHGRSRETIRLWCRKHFPDYRVAMKYAS